MAAVENKCTSIAKLLIDLHWITAVVIITTTTVPTKFVIAAALMIVKCLRHCTGCNLLLIGYNGIGTV